MKVMLNEVSNSVVTIIDNEQTIAVLKKPESTPISDSLLGLLKDSGIKNKNDIKTMRFEQ